MCCSKSREPFVLFVKHMSMCFTKTTQEYASPACFMSVGSERKLLQGDVDLVWLEVRFQGVCRARTPGQRRGAVRPVSAYRALWRWQFSSHWAKSVLETMTKFTLNTTSTGLIDVGMGTRRFNIKARLPGCVSGARIFTEGRLYGYKCRRF